MQKQQEKKKKKRKSSVISSIIIVLLLLIGGGIMAYPTFSDWWNAYHQSRTIASYTEAVDDMDPELVEQILQEADSYNERLLNKTNRYSFTEDEKKEYQSILDPAGSGVMGYVQIKSIGVNLPMYHGTDEKVLQIAVGHIEGTSLPTGGESTHTALSGHRGLPSAKLFSDLDQLKEGDIFTVSVLNRVMTYEVDQISIVLPNDVSPLNIIPGEDYCTLITCTPYGVNTHRLMVRGKRITNLHGDIVILPGAIKIPEYVAIPSVVIPLLFINLALLLWYYQRKKPTMTKLQGEEHVQSIHNAVKNNTINGILPRKEIGKK